MLTDPYVIASLIAKADGACWKVDCLCGACPLRSLCNSRESRTCDTLLLNAVAYIARRTRP